MLTKKSLVCMRNFGNPLICIKKIFHGKSWRGQEDNSNYLKFYVVYNYGPWTMNYLLFRYLYLNYLFFY